MLLSSIPFPAFTWPLTVTWFTSKELIVEGNWHRTGILHECVAFIIAEKREGKRWEGVGVLRDKELRRSESHALHKWHWGGAPSKAMEEQEIDVDGQGRENPKDPMMTSYSCLSWNTGTRPSPGTIRNHIQVQHCGPLGPGLGHRWVNSVLDLG